MNAKNISVPAFFCSGFGCVRNWTREERMRGRVPNLMWRTPSLSMISSYSPLPDFDLPAGLKSLAAALPLRFRVVRGDAKGNASDRTGRNLQSLNVWSEEPEDDDDEEEEEEEEEDG